MARVPRYDYFWLIMRIEFNKSSEYDPEAIAAQSKIAGQAGSAEVATNEMSGTYQPSTNDAPMYTEPPPMQNNLDDYEKSSPPMGQSNQG